MKIAAFLFVFLFVVSAVSATETQVGVYLLSLGKYEVATGSYTADFYLSLKCEEDCNPNYEFLNGRASSIDKIIDTPREKFYRIQANLANKVDLKKYPFDSQELTIVLEDKDKPYSQIRYIPDLSQSGIDESITFTGWNLDSWDAKETKHDYKIYNETYSQYIYSVKISRIVWNSFLKTLFPIIIIVLIALFSFVIDPDKVTQRLAMAGSALIASVMFHVSITNQIPPVGYLTFADKFMMITYGVLLSAFIINILMIELGERKHHHIVEKIHRMTEFSVFLIVPILYAILFIFFR